MKLNIAPARRLLWPALCLFQLGLILGWYIVRAGHDAPADPKPGEHHSPAGSPAPLTPEQVGIEFARGNDLLRQGRYELALAAFRLVEGDGEDASPRLLQYRRTLCLEGLGQWDQALEGYRKAMSGDAAPEARAAAEVGQARVWFRRGRPAEARPLLANLLLRSGNPALRASPAVAEGHYLHALALAHEASPPRPPTPRDDAPARVVPSDRFLTRAAGWEVHVGDTTEKATPDLVEVQRLGNAPEDALVRARSGQWPVGEAVNRLAEQAGLPAEWSAEAQRATQDRALEMDIEGWPLGDVLRAVTAAFGLTWEIADGKLFLRGEQETPAALLNTYRTVGARRALLAALVTAPEHPLAAAARLELGNLEAREGRLTEARTWYEQIGRQGPRTEYAVEAQYNLGLVLRRLGREAEAIPAFYRAIDQSPGHDLAALAYLRIGQVHLDRGEPALAVLPLRRAILYGPGSAVQPAATVTLAAAWLLAGDPRTAHAVLGQYRESVGRPPFRPAAAFLDALARFRLTAAGRASTPEGSDLLASLLALPGAPDWKTPEPLLGISGQLLLGQAYRELGLPERMEEIYRASLRRAKGPIADEMSHSLATVLYARGDRPEAVGLLSALTKADGAPWAARARFSLAEIALEESRAQDCLAACHALLHDGSLPDRGALLTLMGRAFEKLGEHRQAARCFAGQLPAPERWEAGPEKSPGP